MVNKYPPTKYGFKVLFSGLTFASKIAIKIIDCKSNKNYKDKHIEKKNEKFKYRIEEDVQRFKEDF